MCKGFFTFHGFVVKTLKGYICKYSKITPVWIYLTRY
jgi:hypothetical protein